MDNAVELKRTCEFLNLGVQFAMEVCRFEKAILGNEIVDSA